MDKNTISVIIILCLEMVWMPVSCSDPELGLENSPIVLVPGPVNNIDRILWKLNSNKAAEWEKTDQIYYYGGFRDGAKLDVQTGNLTIAKLSTAFSGAYSVEINSQPSRNFVLNVLKPVPKPECTKQCNDTHCNLTCDGEETQYTQYNWTNNKEQKMSGKDWTVSKTGEMDTEYTCTFSSPLSSSTCSVLESEMFPPPEPVSKPKYTKKCNDTHCNLTCKGEETQYTQYYWTNNKGQKMSGKDWTVSKTGEMDTEYTCTFSNPLSSSTCSVLESEMFPPPGLSGGMVALIVIIVLVIVAIGSLVGIKFWRKKIRTGTQKESKSNDPGEDSNMLAKNGNSPEPKGQSEET